MENKTESVPKMLKRQPGLGKINRACKATQPKIVAQGHTLTRFKRDYATGLAVYACPGCGATVTVSVSPKLNVEGSALSTPCAAAQTTKTVSE